MFENFDFSWFTTIPGILTGIGCLLILISIIIFISSLFGKKRKDNENIKEEVKVEDSLVEKTSEVKETNDTPAEVTPVSTEPTVTPVEVTPVTQEPTVTPVEVTPVAPEPTVTPVEVTPVTQEPTVTPVEVTPVAPETTVTPVEITPAEITPQVTSEVATSFEGINIQPEIQPVGNDVEPSLPYGGAKITPEVTPEVEAPKVIYGGADPTEGTGVIPKVENTEGKVDEIESL